MLFAAADCRLWTRPAPDQLLHSATVSVPGPHKRRPGVGCRSVGRALPTKYGGEFWPDASYVEQHRLMSSNIAAGARHSGFCRGQQRVPLALHGLDLLENQFEPIEFTFDLRFEMRG